MNIIKNINQLFDSIGDGLFLVDTRGVVKNANNASCEILGYKGKKMIEGKVCLDLLQAIDDKGNPIDQKNAALFQSIRSGKKVNNAKRQFLKKDGSRIWTSITTSPIHEGKKVKGAIIVIRNITEEKREEEYRKDFANTASHNMRGPIGNLLWAMEYLLSGKPGPLTPKQEEYVKDSYNSLQTINRLVNDLLRISRLQNKKIKPDFKKLSINKIVEETIRDLSHSPDAEKIKINFSPADGREYFVLADYEHVRTIVQNIIENAIRYSFDKTTVEISVKKADGKIIFSCANQGIGIPTDKKKLVFAKFYRAQNAVGQRSDGTGLGMYVSLEFAKLNKGKLWFDSELNKKTTFYLSLQGWGKKD